MGEVRLGEAPHAARRRRACGQRERSDTV